MKILGDFFVRDNYLQNISQFPGKCPAGDIELYEVFRIVDNYSLFLDDHLERLQKSVAITNQSLWFSIFDLKASIEELKRKSNISNGNIKISLRFPGTTRPYWMAFFIPTNYPTPRMYKNGVHCTLLHAERKTPNAKITNRKLRKKANHLIHEQHVFETLLVDHLEEITEGSRSNVFFIESNQIITAPDALVLKGVIRSKVLDIIKEKKIGITFTPLLATRLRKISAAFITGTSPRILPINQIDSIVLEPQHPLIIEIMETLEQQIDTLKKEAINRLF